MISFYFYFTLPQRRSLPRQLKSSPTFFLYTSFCILCLPLPITPFLSLSFSLSLSFFLSLFLSFFLSLSLSLSLFFSLFLSPSNSNSHTQPSIVTICYPGLLIIFFLLLHHPIPPFLSILSIPQSSFIVSNSFKNFISQ